MQATRLLLVPNSYDGMIISIDPYTLIVPTKGVELSMTEKLGQI